MTSTATSSIQSDTHPINRLPPETLGEIFGCVIASGHCSIDSDFRSFSYVTWYNFTFVSRYWRSVALSTPHLWSTLLFLNRKVISVMLERSQTADLSIHVGAYYPYLTVIPLIKEVIDNQSSRITEMSLEISGMAFSSLVEKLKQQPRSLRLRELRLILTTGRYQTFPNAILVPDSLQILNSSGFDFAWEPSQSFPCLTYLAIGATNVGVSISELIAALRGMPALEYMYMHDSLPSEPPVSLVQPVRIPRLRRLDIGSTKDSSQISNFLALIIVPATTNILITCFSCFGRSSVAEARFLAFTTSLHSFVRGMHSEDDNIFYRSLCACPIGQGNTLQILATMANPPLGLANFQLRIETRYARDETLQKILPAFQRDKIESLRLEIGIRSEILLELSDTLPLLEHVVLKRDSMPNFIAVMMIEDHTSFPFQNIRHLTLYRAKFSQGINHDGLEVHELQQCLAARSKHDARLIQLDIIGCDGIYWQDIRRLQGVVDVTWDAHQSPYI